MPAVLETPRLASKQEEFVEKQIESARNRIRTLDLFSAGLSLTIGSLAFLFAVLIIDRYVETPKGTGWGIIGLYLLGAAGYLWLTLFRPSRRQINPYYAARKVESTIPEAKNSVINFVDLKDDASVPMSVKTAIGSKAARDLKQVDLNQAIQKRQILWLAGVAGFFFVASVIAALLPPTRTSLTILTPREGDTIVTQGEDFHLEVAIKGRVPGKSDPDAARVRIWYNPEDPATYEERPLDPIENQTKVLGLTVPAKQVRNGFHYKVLAGNAQSADYEVKLRIIPQFTGWDVEYHFPSYLKRPDEKLNDPNLVGFFGTQVTLTAYTNRPVQSGSVLIGEALTVPGQLVDGNPEAIRFQIPMLENNTYRIRFVTTDGMQNPSPQSFRISLLDPKPAFLNFDVTFNYPKYLHWQPETIMLREPNLEVIRGTKLTIIGNANRPIKTATLEYQGKQLIGEPIKNDPMRVKFALDPVMKDEEHFRVWFEPNTGENITDPRSFHIKVFGDEPPKVFITEPAQDPVDVAANGTLVVKGIADDEYGITKMNLRLEVVGKINDEMKVTRLAQNIALTPKAYRDGISFRRESDQSYPQHVDYMDVVNVARLKADGEPAGFQLQKGMVVEYWLEAYDNCEVPQGQNKQVPNRGESRHQRMVIGDPLKPAQQKQQQKQDQQLQQEKQQHDKKQDDKNANEKRDPKQQPQKGDQPQQQAGGADDKNQQQGKPMEGQGNDNNTQPMPDPNQQQLDKDTERVKNALNPNGQPNQQPQMGDTQPNDPSNPPKMGDNPPKTPNDPNNTPKTGENQPKTPNDPNNPPKMGDNPPKTPNDPNNPPKMGDNPPKTPNDPKNTPKGDNPPKTPNDPNNPPKMGDNPPKTPNDPNNPPKMGDNPPKTPNDPKNTPKTGENQPKKNMGDSSSNPMNSAGSGDTDPKNLPKPEDFQQLADKFQSNDPKEREQAREQLKKLMEDAQKNPPDKQEQQKKLNEHRNSLDEKEKEKFDKAMEKLQQEMKNQKLDEKVQKAADKAMSNNEAERKQGQQELQDLMKENPNEVEQELQRLEGKESNQERKQRLDDADRLSRENLKKQNSSPMPPMPPPKPKENVDELAKKMNKGTPEEQQQAKNELENKMKDPNQRQQVEQKLKDFRDKLGSEEEKKNFDKSMQQMRDDVAKQQNGGSGDSQPMPKPEDVERFAKQLQSDDPAERKQAQKQLENAMKEADKDPKAREKAQETVQKMRDNIKDENKKKDFDKAIDQINKSVQEQREEQAKAQQEAVDQLAKDLNSKDSDKQQQAQQKLENMLQDPQKKDSVKNQLDQAKQGMGGDAQKKIDDAVKQAEDKLAKKDAKGGDTTSKKDNVAKKDGNGGDTQPKKEDLNQLAKDLNSKDPAKQQAAQQKLEEMLKDPKNREAVQKGLDEMKKGMTGEQAKNLDEAMKKADKDLAKKDGKGDTTSKKDDLNQLARDLNSNDPAKKAAAQQKLEEMLQDPKNKEAVKKGLDEMKKGMTGEQAKNIDEAMKKADKDLAKKDALKKEDLERLGKKLDELAKDFKNLDPDKKKAIEEKLQETLKDPKAREEFEKYLEQLRNQMKDGKSKEDLDKLSRRAKEIADQLAKKDAPSGGKGNDLTKHDGKQPGGNTDVEAPDTLTKMKKDAKAGELLLEQFKQKQTNEEFRKRLGWSDEQMKRWIKQQQNELNKLKAQIELSEKGELPMPHVAGPSALPSGPERINLEERNTGKPQQSGRGSAPPGFGDSYKRFTEDVSGVRSNTPKK